MNQTIENILNRRSIRVFTEEKVNEDMLKEIVKAGLYAPSSKNKQLWHFTVIQNESLLRQLNSDTKNAIKKYAKEKISDPKVVEKLLSKAENDTYDTFYNAPVAIIVSQNSTDKTSPTSF